MKTLFILIFTFILNSSGSSSQPCFLEPFRSCVFTCDVDPKTLTYRRTEINEIEAINMPSTYAVPNPSKGEFDIYYFSIETGKVRIKIFDAIGNELSNFEGDKTSNKFILPINLKPLSIGSYRYTIEINNIKTISSKIVIIK